MARLSEREARREEVVRLDDIRPRRWVFTQELLELLWVLEATIDLEPQARELFEKVLASDLFSYLELPQPTDEERRPPGAEHAGEPAQAEMDLG